MIFFHLMWEKHERLQENINSVNGNQMNWKTSQSKSKITFFGDRIQFEKYLIVYRSLQQTISVAASDDWTKIDLAFLKVNVWDVSKWVGATGRLSLFVYMCFFLFSCDESFVLFVSVICGFLFDIVLFVGLGTISFTILFELFWFAWN